MSIHVFRRNGDIERWEDYPPGAIHDKISISGHLKIQVHDLDGTLLRELDQDNLVVKTGRNLVRDLIGAFTTAYPSHLGAGTSNAAVTDDDIALGSESTRILIISRTQGTSRLTIRAFMGSTVGNGITYAEAGLFNGLASNSTTVMFSRAIHDSITKSASNTITYIWTLTIASS